MNPQNIWNDTNVYASGVPFIFCHDTDSLTIASRGNELSHLSYHGCHYFMIALSCVIKLTYLFLWRLTHKQAILRWSWHIPVIKRHTNKNMFLLSGLLITTDKSYNRLGHIHFWRSCHSFLLENKVENGRDLTLAHDKHPKRPTMHRRNDM